MSYRSSASDSVCGWHAGGLYRAARRFLAFLGHSACRRSCVSRPGWRASSARKQWKFVKTCWFLLPWLGDAFDKKHGLETPSVHDGECVARDVKPSRCARAALSDEQEERTSDSRARVLGGHGTVAATGSVHDARQGYASTLDAKDFCKQHGPPSLNAF